jgi:uncharacterized membrane protein YkvA (DUF1232 family)
MERKDRTARLIGAGLAILVGVIYLLNPSAGFIELIPDNLPVVGNLDEAGATALLLWGLAQFRGGTNELPDEQPKQ